MAGLAGPSVGPPAQPPAQAGSPRAGGTAPRPGCHGGTVPAPRPQRADPPGGIVPATWRGPPGAAVRAIPGRGWGWAPPPSQPRQSFAAVSSSASQRMGSPGRPRTRSSREWDHGGCGVRGALQCRCVETATAFPPLADAHPGQNQRPVQNQTAGRKPGADGGEKRFVLGSESLGTFSWNRSRAREAPGISEQERACR